MTTHPRDTHTVFDGFLIRSRMEPLNPWVYPYGIPSGHGRYDGPPLLPSSTFADSMRTRLGGPRPCCTCRKTPAVLLLLASPPALLWSCGQLPRQVARSTMSSSTSPYPSLDRRRSTAISSDRACANLLQHLKTCGVCSSFWLSCPHRHPPRPHHSCPCVFR